MSSAYEILGLGEGATLEEASRAYRRLALRYHPDRFVGRPASEVTAAQAAFVEVQLAYEEVHAIIRSGGPSRSRPRSGPRRTDRSASSPGPTAAQVVEHEVARVLADDGWIRRQAGFPTSFLARRAARGVTTSMADVGWLRIAPRSEVDRAALGFASFILRPPTGPLFDPTMIAFCTDVAVLALRGLDGRLTPATRAALWERVPQAAASHAFLSIPRFCNVCLVAPAPHVAFRVVIGTLFWHRWQFIDAQRCADCAEPLFRDVQSALLRSGWWGPTAFVLTPVQLWRNHRAIEALRDLGSPTRPRELPVAPPTPKISSRRSSWLSPAAAVLLVVWLVSRFFVGAASPPGAGAATSHPARSTTTTVAGEAAVTPSSTTAPPTIIVAPHLARPWSRTVRLGGVVSPQDEAGPLVESAGGRVHAYTGISVHDGVVDGFTLNLPDHTTEAQARWLVAAALPADARTTYVKEIKTYDNARDLLVGECVAWDLSSTAMADAFSARGVLHQRVIAVVLSSSTAANRRPTTGRTEAERMRALLKALTRTLPPGDGDFDPINVTSAQVFTMAPHKPINQCWVPDEPRLP